MLARDKNRYHSILENVFFGHYNKGMDRFGFDRTELVAACQRLSIEPPKNLGDIIYSARYRAGVTPRIEKTAKPHFVWLIMPAGKARYEFVQVEDVPLEPNPGHAETRVPDATPGIIALYALGDEQALLARIRYNRLLDVFTGVTCYSLQNHLRTTVPAYGQIETDELYVGLDRYGVHYVLPVQAKTKRDRLGVVQLLQDYAFCEARYPDLVVKPIGAQFLASGAIAMLEYRLDKGLPRIAHEEHYRLVQPEELTLDELAEYRKHLTP